MIKSITLKKNWSRIYLEKKLGNFFHSENASKFTKICQVKT